MDTEQTLPDFLLIGAAKAGTSALYSALSQHPELFASPSKEPRYLAFAGAQPSYRGPGDSRLSEQTITRESEYRRLFVGAGHKKKFEGSALYLWSESTPARAAALVPGARLIVILRQPVDRAFSQWLDLRRDLLEPLSEFEAAVAQEAARKRAGWSFLWLYLERGLYARQLRRWLQHYPREQLLVLFHEDWLAQPERVLDQVWQHVGVEPPRVPIEIARENASQGAPRSVRIHRLLHESAWLRPQPGYSLLAPIGRAVRRVGDRLNRWPRPNLDPRVRRRLTSLFSDDIRDLAALTGRDLSAWVE